MSALRSGCSGGLWQRWLTGIERIEPVLWRQHGHPVREPGFVALCADRSEFPRWLHFTAHGRPLGVNAAMRGLADDTLQGVAARRRGTGAAHHHPVWIELLGEFRRHAAAQKGIRFRPMKRHAKKRAAGTATQTGMLHEVDQAHPEVRSRSILVGLRGSSAAVWQRRMRMASASGLFDLGRPPACAPASTGTGDGKPATAVQLPARWLRACRQKYCTAPCRRC